MTWRVVRSGADSIGRGEGTFPPLLLLAEHWAPWVEKQQIKQHWTSRKRSSKWLLLYVYLIVEQKVEGNDKKIVPALRIGRVPPPTLKIVLAPLVVRVARVVTSALRLSSVSRHACFNMADDEVVVFTCTSLVFCAPNLHQSQEKLLEKMKWTCPRQSTLWRRPWTRVVRFAPEVTRRVAPCCSTSATRQVTSRLFPVTNFTDKIACPWRDVTSQVEFGFLPFCAVNVQKKPARGRIGEL